jgi:hypothetical protein
VTPTVSYGRRAASYWFADGLPEILFGLALVIMAAMMFLWRMYAPKPWIRFDWWIMGAGFTFYYLMERRVLDFLKSHFTYPRRAMCSLRRKRSGGSKRSLLFPCGPTRRLRKT